MSDSSLGSIRTPDQRLRVFISSTIAELAPEREAVMEAVKTLRLSPVMFELGARPHPPRDLYRAYLEQSDMFVGIYWQSYGWVAPDESISGIEDEYLLSSSLPRLIYVKHPAPERHDRLTALLERIKADDTTSYRRFATADELAELVLDDLALLVTERFHVPRPASLPTGTLSFSFIELEDDRRLQSNLGSGYSRFIHDFHATVTNVADANRGHVVVVDGSVIFCVFAEAHDAVAAAGAIHAELATKSLPTIRPSCRVGIHTGSSTRTEFGYVGADVTHAAQIKSAANGGQTLISAATKVLISDAAEERGWAVVGLGNFRFDGSGPEQLYRVDFRDQAVEDSAPRARPAGQFVAPLFKGKLIGRDRDLPAVKSLLGRSEVRMVSITGPGGTGKTRLAAELSRQVEPSFPGGVCFLDMSPMRDPSRFMAAIGKAFGVRESSERSIIDALVLVIRSERVLLILDNMEQLLDSAGDISEVLGTIPDLKVLVTSRAPLRISWEHEYPLAPLVVPDHGDTYEEIEQSDAVSLFVDRARAVRPDFDVSPENAAVIAQISRRLDGLPLAIELAAARLRMFSPEGLLERLDDRLNVLNQGSRDAPERHRTMRGAIDWSLDLLGEDERKVFGRLGVFSGGWPLEAALSVCADERLGEVELLDIVDELVAKSLIVFSNDRQPRYRMLETLRERALEELIASGESDRIRVAHLDWLVSAARFADDGKATAQYSQVLDDLERERANIWSALRWSAETGRQTEEALTLCGLLSLFWETRGYLAEGLRWTETLLEVTALKPDNAGTALALHTVGWLAMLAGDPARSEEAFTRADGIWREQGDEKSLAWCLAMSGMTTYNRGDLAGSRRMFDEAVVLGKRHGLDWLADVWCAFGLAHLALAEGDIAGAKDLLFKTWTASTDAGIEWGAGHAQLSLGVLAFLEGRLDEAIERVADSLRARLSLRDSRGIADCIGMMAVFAVTAGDMRWSAQLLGAMETMRQASGQRTVPWQAPFIEEANASCRRALGGDFDTEYAIGAGMGWVKASERTLEWAAAQAAMTPA